MTNEAALRREAAEMVKSIDAHHARARALLLSDGLVYRAAVVKAQDSMPGSADRDLLEVVAWLWHHGGAKANDGEGRMITKSQFHQRTKSAQQHRVR
jgi:hypothetical protein